MAKRIGITCSIDTGPAGEPHSSSLKQSYVRAVRAGEGIPIALPVAPPDTAPAYLDIIDALLLSGGADIDPGAYGRPFAGARETTPDRDAFEIALARLAIERDIPVFGICRGIQTLNVALGGTLVQHLPEPPDAQIFHARSSAKEARHVPAHAIRIDPRSKLAGIVGATDLEVNSFHHQALDRLGDRVIPVAWAEDGTIEAAEVEGCKWVVAVQYHPEDMTDTDGAARRLFAAFCSA